MSRISSLTLSTSVTSNANGSRIKQIVDQEHAVPLSGSIVRLPSSVLQLPDWRLSGPELLTRGRYSHPEVRSGTHLDQAGDQGGEPYLLEPASLVVFLSQPYWWPTTAPTNQEQEAALGEQHLQQEQESPYL